MTFDAPSLDHIARGKPHAACINRAGQKVRLANERGDKPVHRLCVNVARGADLLDFAGAHHPDAVAHRQGFFLVMGDEDEGDSGFKLQALQLDLHFLAQLQVQCRQRLVQQQHLGLRGQRAGQCHALLLAAGQLTGLAVRHRSQLHQRQHLGSDRRDLGRRAALHFQPETDVLRHGQMREQGIALEHGIDGAAVGRVLGDILAIQQDFPRSRRFEAGDQAQQRSLAAARGTKKRKELTLADVYRDIVKRTQGAVALAKGLYSVADFHRDVLVHKPISRFHAMIVRVGL